MRRVLSYPARAFDLARKQSRRAVHLSRINGSWSNSASLCLCTRYFIYWWKYRSDRICRARNGKYLWHFANAILFGSVIIENREYQIYVRAYGTKQDWISRSSDLQAFILSLCRCMCVRRDSLFQIVALALWYGTPALVLDATELFERIFRMIDM